MLGLGQACHRKARGNKQLGAKSLDRDLGDVHTWPHSHYLMRPCDGVGAAKIEAVDAKCAGRKM